MSIRKRAILAALPFVFLLAACGGETGADSLGSVDGRPVTGDLKCSVMKAGEVLPKGLANGCTRDDGTIIVPGLRTCKDGRLLYGEGEGAGYISGYLGEVAQAGDVAFGRFYDECTGTMSAGSSVPVTSTTPDADAPLSGASASSSAPASPAPMAMTSEPTYAPTVPATQPSAAAPAAVAHHRDGSTSPLGANGQPTEPGSWFRCGGRTGTWQDWPCGTSPTDPLPDYLQTPTPAP